MKAIKLSMIFVLVSLFLSISSNAQVSNADMSQFAEKLNSRRTQEVGVNPNSRDFMQVPFGPINYKGVKQISTKFMSDIYPNQDMRLVNGMFTTLGLDKVVFDKFILQLFLYADGDKDIASSLIYLMCGDPNLSKRIYDRYSVTNATLIKRRLQSNPYIDDIKERNE